MNHFTLLKTHYDINALKTVPLFCICIIPADRCDRKWQNQLFYWYKPLLYAVKFCDTIILWTNARSDLIFTSIILIKLDWPLTFQLRLLILESHQILKHSFLRNHWPIELKLHLKTSYDKLVKIVQNIIFSESTMPIELKFYKKTHMIS